MPQPGQCRIQGTDFVLSDVFTPAMLPTVNANAQAISAMPL
jgi:hypothetical protein